MISSFTATSLETYRNSFYTTKLKLQFVLTQWIVYVIKVLHVVKTENNTLYPLHKCARYFHKS